MGLGDTHTSPAWPGLLCAQGACRSPCWLKRIALHSCNLHVLNLPRPRHAWRLHPCARRERHLAALPLLAAVVIVPCGSATCREGAGSGWRRRRRPCMRAPATVPGGGRLSGTPSLHRSGTIRDTHQTHSIAALTGHQLQAAVAERLRVAIIPQWTGTASDPHTLRRHNMHVRPVKQTTRRGVRVATLQRSGAAAGGTTPPTA